MTAMPETWVRSLGREDPLEKEMATQSSTLAWKIPWTEKALQIAGERREAKGKGGGKGYTEPNAVFREQQGEIRKPS